MIKLTLSQTAKGIRLAELNEPTKNGALNSENQPTSIADVLLPDEQELEMIRVFREQMESESSYLSCIMQESNSANVIVEKGKWKITYHRDNDSEDINIAKRY